MLNIVRINQLTSDMSWRPGIPKKVEESKWVTSIQSKAKSIAIISKVFPYKPEDIRRRSNKRRSKSGKRRSNSITSGVSEISSSVYSDDISAASNVSTFAHG